MPDRIQLRRSKGWRMPPNCRKVDRSTRWGNPFIPGLPSPNAPATIVADKHHAYLLYKAWAPTQKALVDDAIEHLQGKDLACWCSADTPCHADVLLELSNPATPLHLTATEIAERYYLLKGQKPKPVNVGICAKRLGLAYKETMVDVMRRYCTETVPLRLYSELDLPQLFEEIARSVHFFQPAPVLPLRTRNRK